MSTLHSTVKWFDAKKGYGFINHPDGGDDIFVHYSQIESDEEFKTLRTGQSVEFELEDGPKGLHALSVIPGAEDPGAEGPGPSSDPAARDGKSSDSGGDVGAEEDDTDDLGLSSGSAGNVASPPR
jgi:CspA family cold shock protein